MPLTAIKVATLASLLIESLVAASGDIVPTPFRQIIRSSGKTDSPRSFLGCNCFFEVMAAPAQCNGGYLQWLRKCILDTADTARNFAHPGSSLITAFGHVQGIQSFLVSYSVMKHLGRIRPRS